MQSWLRMTLSVGAALLATSAQAKDFTEADIPAPLKPWTAWVMAEEEKNPCPFLFSDAAQRQCIWPGQLDLSLTQGGGKFAFEVMVYQKSWVALPGDAERWPQSLEVNDAPGTVSAKGGQPGMMLEPGHYVIRGAFFWKALPEMLTLPASTALLHVNLDGKEIAFPEIDAQNRLWVSRPQEENAAQNVADHLEVKVFRHLIDAIPFQTETRLLLNVSGKNREALLGQTLLEDFVPMAIESELPARLEPDGRLRLQLRPGTWEVTIRSRHDAPVTALALSGGKEPLAAQEIWSFEAQNQLRLVELQGAPTIDPAQTELPEEWKGFPAYLMNAETKLALNEKRRGNSEAAADELNLARIWRLDFDGNGFSVQDKMNGVIRQSARLEAQPELALGRVTISGQGQFITKLSGADTSPGVEVRPGPLALEADGRLESDTRSLAATGWKHDVRSLAGTLFLPPGWTLFTVTGVDKVSSTWLQDWTLLDLFVVLLASVATFKLMGRQTAIVMAVGLTLLHPELPGITGAVLFLLAAFALLKYLPEGAFRKIVSFLRGWTALGLVLAASVFMMHHLRGAIYPQLQGHFSSETAGDYGFASVAGVAASVSVSADGALVPEAVPPAPSPEEAGVKMDVGAGVRFGAGKITQPARKLMMKRVESQAPEQQSSLYQYAPDAKVQTGYGVTHWQAQRVSLNWNGPVDGTQRFRLWLISPGVNLLLAFVRVGLLGAIIVMLLRGQITLPNLPRFLRKGTALAVLLGFATLLMAQASYAQSPAPAAQERGTFPPEPLLAELKARLLKTWQKPPSCLPECAVISRSDLAVSAQQLTLTQEAHLSDAAIIPLPGDVRNWRPAEVTVDGKKAAALRAGDDGYLQLELPKGTHRIEMKGSLPTAGQKTVSITFPLASHWTSAQASGWEVQGIHADGKSDGTVQLSRSVNEAAQKNEPTLKPAALPPFLEVHRTVSFGLSWQVETTVQRLTPEGEAVAVRIPLLPGETVTSEGVTVEDGKVFLSFGPGDTEKQWSATLPVAPALKLTAPEKAAWVEVWEFQVSNLWHANFTGIPSIHLSEGQSSQYYQPWPGESVQVALERPVGVEGQTVTIDDSNFTVQAGQRSLEAELAMKLRSSLGSQYQLTLPAEAKLKSVAINGTPLAAQPKNGVLTVPLTPGQQQLLVTWTQPQGMSARFEVPKVDVGMRSVNAQVQLHLPEDRWLLLARGPQMGPAVLFWGILPVIALFAYGLGKTGYTPLKARHWFLLLLGLSQTTMTTGLIVIGWLLLLGWRERNEQRGISAYNFNFRQFALGFLTLMAISCLFSGIKNGLLGAPDMQVQGNNSLASVLRWYQDITAQVLPQPVVYSLPIFVYRFLMLLWALWLASAFTRWLKWAWQSFTFGGYWRTPEPKPVKKMWPEKPKEE